MTDSRPSKHVKWLEAAGYQVDVLASGAAHPTATGRHSRISVPSLPLRLGAYSFLPHRARFRYLVGSRVPPDLIPDPHSKYDLVVVHELDLLPWFQEHASELTDGPVLLDLGEYFGSHGIGALYRMLFERYHRWLFRLVADPAFTIRTTVSAGIADLYALKLGIDRPSVTLNVAGLSDLGPTAVEYGRLRLVHHGRADLGRGLEFMLDAMLLVDDRFSLVLMLVGSEREVEALRRHPAVATGRIEFRPPVPLERVAEAINDCDLEVIFFPPKTENLRYVLPNKLFEAVQGRLGLIVGESVEMVDIVEHAGNGLVVPEWTSESLAATLATLDTEQVRRFKDASHGVAAAFSEDKEGIVFLDLIAPGRRGPVSPR